MVHALFAAAAASPFAAVATLIVGGALLCAAIFSTRQPVDGRHVPRESPASPDSALNSPSPKNPAPAAVARDVDPPEALALASGAQAPFHNESNGPPWWLWTILTMLIMVAFGLGWEAIAAWVLLDVIGHAPWIRQIWRKACTRWPAPRPLGELFARLHHSPLGHSVAGRSVTFGRQLLDAVWDLLQAAFGFLRRPAWSI